MHNLFDHITLDKVALGRLTEEFRRSMEAQTARLSTDWPLTTMAPGYGMGTAPGLTEADVRRIVREELEAAKPGPLDVTPDDVKRWAPGLKS